MTPFVSRKMFVLLNLNLKGRRETFRATEVPLLSGLRGKTAVILRAEAH